MKKCAALILTALLLCGCGGGTEAEPDQLLTEPAGVTAPSLTETVPPETVDASREAQVILEEPPLPASVVLMPEASGLLEQRCEEAVIDYSHTEDGYVMVQYTAETDRRLKVRITRGDVIFTYDLNGAGEYEVLPLQLGSGGYRCTLYKCVQGNRYAQEGRVDFSANMENEESAFLCPNQYVDYGPDSAAVALSMEICQGLEGDSEKFEAIKKYLTRNFVYDFVKAATVAPGAMPDMDGCLEKRMGICQDLAALAASMLRVQGIPAKLVIGYADANYHAWNSVLVDGEYRLMDITSEINAISKNVTYTVERFY